MSMVPKTFKEARATFIAMGGKEGARCYVGQKALLREESANVMQLYCVVDDVVSHRVVAFHRDGTMRLSSVLRAATEAMQHTLAEALHGSNWSLRKSLAGEGRWLLCHASGRRRVFVGDEVLRRNDTFDEFEARIAFAALASEDKIARGR